MSLDSAILLKGIYWNGIIDRAVKGVRYNGISHYW